MVPSPGRRPVSSDLLEPSPRPGELTLGPVGDGSGIQGSVLGVFHFTSGGCCPHHEALSLAGKVCRQDLEWNASDEGWDALVLGGHFERPPHHPTPGSGCTS